MQSENCDYVIVSGYHDYRSKRKADLHFIADHLKQRGDVFFLSLRFSRLSYFKEDPRHDLLDRVNRLETSNGVLCYLRYTLTHPFGLPKPLRVAEEASFSLYASYLPKAVRARIASAKVVFIESGIAIAFIPLIKHLSPSTKIIYMASDSLDAIGQAQTIRRNLNRYANFISGARVPSPYLAEDISSGVPTFFVPHGIDKEAFGEACPSPYDADTINAVSVGSMLFDPTFFQIAGKAYPHVKFHVIGSGHEGLQQQNVVFYPEMPFQATIPYLKHSTFAIAAYGQGVEKYLAHTSMKLMQYQYLGRPAVCPQLVALPECGRYGYNWDDITSISDAIGSAISAQSVPHATCLDWFEVTNQLMTKVDNVQAR